MRGALATAFHIAAHPDQQPLVQKRRSSSKYKWPTNACPQAKSGKAGDAHCIAFLSMNQLTAGKQLGTIGEVSWSEPWVRKTFVRQSEDSSELVNSW